MGGIPLNVTYLQYSFTLLQYVKRHNKILERRHAIAMYRESQKIKDHTDPHQT